MSFPALTMRLIPASRMVLSRAGPSIRRNPIRTIASTSHRSDIASEIEKQLNPREVIERKRKLFEEKYGDKLKKKAEQEGVADLDALKVKKMVPSIRTALKSKAPRKAQDEKKLEEQKEASVGYSDTVDRSRPARSVDPEEANKSGIKPLANIINLPLLHLTPHTTDAISKIWTAYHTSHKTLSSSFLSASLPSSTYTAMIELAQENPFFVLPLPRDAAESSDGKVRTDEYEMFYLQWLFHPTPTSAPAPPGREGEALPPTTSIIFTPLEEYKRSGEWASPFLVLSHYPDLALSHDVVLMRGEITAQSATGPPGSLVNPGWLLSQQQAQLLALALQRFYCAGVIPRNETAGASLEREKRKQALKSFRTEPEKWDWTKLVNMAYGGMV